MTLSVSTKKHICHDISNNLYSNRIYRVYVGNNLILNEIYLSVFCH